MATLMRRQSRLVWLTIALAGTNLGAWQVGAPSASIAWGASGEDPAKQIVPREGDQPPTVTGPAPVGPSSAGRSRYSFDKARQPTTSPTQTGSFAPWQDVPYEDMALLVKTARRAMETLLESGQEIAPRYQPPGLREKTGIICLRLRKSGSLVCEVTTSRLPIVEASNSAGVLLAQAIIQKKLRADDAGRGLGLELEWLGLFEYLDARPAAEGHWSDDLLHSFEPAAEGIGVEFRGKQGWTCPSEIITRNYSPDLALAAAESQVGLQFIHKIRLIKDIRYFRFPALHLWQSDSRTLPVRLSRGELLIEQDTVSDRAVDEAIARMTKYLHYLQMADGGFAEEYQPSGDRFEHGPTPRLQMQAMSTLAELCAWKGKGTEEAVDVDYERLERSIKQVMPLVKPIHRAAKDAQGKVTVEEAGLALQFPGEAESLEATARLLMILLTHRNGTHARSDPKREKTMRGLAQAILASQGTDGRLELMLEASEPAKHESVRAAALGMAALVGWNAKAADPAVLPALERARLHYKSLYSTTSPEPESAAMLARALTQLYSQTNDARCSDLVFAILDRVASLQVTPAACPMPELWGAINAGEPGVVGIDTALYVAALADGFMLAQRVGDKARAERYRSAAILGVRFILQLQYSEAGCFYVRTPRDAVGGVRLAPWNNRIRVDRCGDALIALIQCRRALWGEP